MCVCGWELVRAGAERSRIPASSIGAARQCSLPFLPAPMVRPRGALVAAAVVAATAVSALPSRQSLASTPPRGWLSWGRFRCFTDCSVSPDDCISERLVLRTAKAMVAQGFNKAGYTTVNIDSCWASRDRDPSTGLIVGNTSRFPRGMKALADDLHAMNLSLGLYTNMGPVMGLHNGPGLNCSSASYAENGCAQARKDIETMASWGIDMLKIDGDSGADSVFMNRSYPLVDSFLRQATAQVAGARSIVYSCSWPAYTTNGRGMPIQYGLMRKHCNLWRNYKDIQPEWSSLKGAIEYWGSLTGGRSPVAAGPLGTFVGAAGPGAWCDSAPAVFSWCAHDTGFRALFRCTAGTTQTSC